MNCFTVSAAAKAPRSQHLWKPYLISAVVVLVWNV